MPYKVCVSCSEKNGVRASQCIKCKKPFKIKQKKEKLIQEVETDFDWHTLLPGNDIKVAQGSGPTYTYTNSNDEKVKEYVGHYGWFRVDSLTSEGIKAYEIIPVGQGQVKTGGFAFIYMNKKPRVMASGTVMSAHKILKVKKHGTTINTD